MELPPRVKALPRQEIASSSELVKKTKTEEGPLHTFKYLMPSELMLMTVDYYLPLAIEESRKKLKNEPTAVLAATAAADMMRAFILSKPEISHNISLHNTIIQRIANAYGID